jgi:hypothetical protein
LLVRVAQQFGGDEAGGLQDLARVAVVDLQDGGAALRLHAHALEAELLVACAFIDALCIVVQKQQAVGGRVHHLRHEFEPRGCEVVAFVDQDRLVLAGRDLLALHGADDLAHHLVLAQHALRLDRVVQFGSTETPVCPAAPRRGVHSPAPRTTHRKPMWLVPVSISCGCRAAGR